ncbi:IclR family transcriptional regulator [Bordetella sp. BOR01]|uniref:IclR family transcriptional regulator n=1 Tax=Bordetella sp. BOR01 TaxID=2854779 RepID=UPI001C455138|nr:IclR family transcriptional regulator [Bordetella sp. BOR01]MBV7483174.1 IclR family transcriptional regulator [Bordetella sp. BOR01]
MRTDGVKSADRVLDLLELLSAARVPMRLTDVVNRLGIPKSSAFALLATVVRRGYVEERPDGYCLAAQFRSSGWVGGERARLITHAKPFMRTLAQTCDESVFLGVMSSARQIEYIDKELTSNPLRYDADMAKIREAYATTVGHVLLADLPAQELDDYLAAYPLVALTEKTQVDRQALRAAIAAAARNGYAQLTDSHLMGVSGVAAPVRDGSGKAVAGLCAFGPGARVLPKMEQLTRQLIDSAHQISIALGWTPRAHEENAS